MNFFLFTDGGCHGNPGPGGWAWRLVDRSNTVVAERYGSESTTTNNKMELAAVINGLQEVHNRINSQEIDGDAEVVEVVTDSQYVRQGITDWIKRWRVNGWQTSAKKPVKNRELWQRLDEVNSKVSPRWRWVKGHAGDEHNEACDRLVQQAIGEVQTR